MLTGAAAPWHWALPRGQLAPRVPADNGMSAARVELGRRLFQRTLISFDSPYDRWRRGDPSAMPAQEVAGAALFAKDCAACHSGPMLSDSRFHRIVVAAARDRGLGEISGRSADNGRFRTAGLRNVALTAPYFHDGSAATIEIAIRRHPGAGAKSNVDIAALTTFLATLTDRHFVTGKAFSLPDTACGKPL